MSESRGSSYSFVCFLKDKNLMFQFGISKGEKLEVAICDFKRKRSRKHGC